MNNPKRIAPLADIGHVYDMGVLYAAGPITHQPASVVFRVVLLYNKSKGEWIVYYEDWLHPVYDTEGNLAMNMELSHLRDGFYTEEFDRAVTKFCDRINKPEQLRSALRGNESEAVPAG